MKTLNNIFKKLKYVLVGVLCMITLTLSHAQGGNTLIQGGANKGTYINWTEGKRYAQAEGIGVWPKEGCEKGQDWCKLMAEDAAEVEAQAELLELIKGVIVERETTVGDLMASSTSQSYISGVVRGARKVGEPQHIGRTVKITMRMPLDGNLTDSTFVSQGLEGIYQDQAIEDSLALDTLRQENQKLKGVIHSMESTLAEVAKKQRVTQSLLRRIQDQNTSKLVAEVVLQLSKQEKLIEKAPKAPVARIEKAMTETETVLPQQIPTGLIIDASELTVEPVKFIRLFDENLNEVYANRFIDRDYAIKHGGAGYVKTMKDAQSEDRLKINGKINPVVIKPIGTFQDKGRDFILTNEDAANLRNWLKTAAFLREARVIVALK